MLGSAWGWGSIMEVEYLDIIWILSVCGVFGLGGVICDTLLALFWDTRDR